MLNRINDEASAELIRFYREQLEAGAKGSGEYEAHLSLGLLYWRVNDGAGSDRINYHLAEAARCAAALYQKRKTNHDSHDNDLFEFMIPLFTVLIAGDENTRRIMAEIDICYWASEQPAEFKSLVLFFDLLRRHLIDVRYSDVEVNTVLAANNNPETHLFYKPWIEAYCAGILAVNTADNERVAAACQRLLDFHRKEALSGDWQLKVEGLLSFWGSGLLNVAKSSGVNIDISKRYLYEYN